MTNRKSQNTHRTLSLQIPPELGAAYDKTSSLEQQMMDNFDSRSQKVWKPCGEKCGTRLEYCVMVDMHVPLLKLLFASQGQLKWQYFVDDTTGFFRKFPAVVVETSKCGKLVKYKSKAV